jgi:sugar O-acyltransferase (sialic acid O-acetyltransferase NeuD family)
MTLVLIGGGGHAAVVADVARAAGFTIAGVLTPKDATPSVDLPRLGDDDWVDAAPSDIGFHLAFGHLAGRRSVFARLHAAGRRLPIITATTATVGSRVSVGDGSILMNGTIVNAGSTIGRNCIVNTRAVVEHDCRIGDHTHIAPGAIIAGGVSIGEAVMVGAGAVLLPGVSVAAHVVIGAGAVVVRSIEEQGTWFGNPARQHP